MRKLHETNEMEGLKNEDFNRKIRCDICERGKKSVTKFKKKNKVRTKEFGEIIHSDVRSNYTNNTWRE